MQKPSRVVKNEAVNLDGLDQVFEVDCEPVENGANEVPTGFSSTAEHRAKHSAGMSLKAAAIHYRLGMSTLRAKIKRGEIPAEKIDGANGPEWRVFVASSVVRDPVNHPVNHPANHGAEQGIKTLLTGHQATSNESVNPLVELVDKQAAKLEAAAGQIGYLSAQLDNYQKQVLMLPDLEARAERVRAQDEEIAKMSDELTRLKSSWWYRLSRFLSGNSI